MNIQTNKSKIINSITLFISAPVFVKSKASLVYRILTEENNVNYAQQKIII